MSKEQIKKDLLMQQAFCKARLNQLRHISQSTGADMEREINLYLDRMIEIERILTELEKRK